jgi:hypothetical protein
MIKRKCPLASYAIKKTNKIKRRRYEHEEVSGIIGGIGIGSSRLGG